MSARRTSHRAATGVMAAGLALIAWAAVDMSGCQKKEPVFEMETPGLDIEVNRTGDGTTEIEVQTGDDAQDKSE